MKAFKGFNKDLKCRDFQYEIGQEYTEDNAKVCECGFHSCINPMDVFSYYSPTDDNGEFNRFCEVEIPEECSKSEDDSKVANKKIKIGAEIGLRGLITAGVNFILEKVNWEDATATNTGDWSAASVEGHESIAIVTGYDSKAKGALNCFIVIAERNNEGKLLNVKAARVDGKTIKADTYYKLIEGEFVECVD